MRLSFRSAYFPGNIQFVLMTFLGKRERNLKNLMRYLVRAEK